MAYHKYKAYHLHEFLGIVDGIGRKTQIAPGVPPVLWSRGHRKTDYRLLPTLLRDEALNPLSWAPQTSGRALTEEFRKEHYIAKNFHYLDKDPKSTIEWLEVMQHHGVKTRLLDWTESVMHSLIFSLECFINKREYRDEDRRTCSPCIWILEPIPWNSKAIELLFSNRALISDCIASLPTSDAVLISQIDNRINVLGQNAGKYLDNISTRHLQGIFNFSSIIGELRGMHESELLYQLKEGEPYYCLAYIFAFAYMNTHIHKRDNLLPISIVEPYHSERIVAQHGAFTLFPYYDEDAAYKKCKAAGIPLDAMEFMYQANTFLHRILLCDPEKIAFEVLNAGMNLSWLYPEMPVVSSSIEERKIY